VVKSISDINNIKNDKQSQVRNNHVNPKQKGNKLKNNYPKKNINHDDQVIDIKSTDNYKSDKNIRNNNRNSKNTSKPSMFSTEYQVDDSKHGNNISKYDTTYKNDRLEDYKVDNEINLECVDPNAPNC